MPKPWEVTPEEARREAEELRERRSKADRQDSSLFALQLVDDELPPEEPKPSPIDEEL